MRILCPFQSFRNKAGRSQKSTRLFNTSFIVRLLACVRACVSVEEIRWGQIPDFESLLHATAARLRSNGNRWVSRTRPITPPLSAGGESWAGGGRTHRTSLPRIQRRKSQENTPVVLCRSSSSHACRSRGFGERQQRKAAGPLAACDGSVAALRCWNAPPRLKHSLKGPELVSSLSFFWISGLLDASVDLHTSSDLVD